MHVVRNYMLCRRLTEVAAEVESLSSRTPLVTVDAAVWSYVDTKLVVGACELVQAAVFIVLDVTQQLLETAVSTRHTIHADICSLSLTASKLVIFIVYTAIR